MKEPPLPRLENSGLAAKNPARVFGNARNQGGRGSAHGQGTLSLAKTWRGLQRAVGCAVLRESVCGWPAARRDLLHHPTPKAINSHKAAEASA